MLFLVTYFAPFFGIKAPTSTVAFCAPLPSKNKGNMLVSFYFQSPFKSPSQWIVSSQTWLKHSTFHIGAMWFSYLGYVHFHFSFFFPSKMGNSGAGKPVNVFSPKTSWSKVLLAILRPTCFLDAPVWVVAWSPSPLWLVPWLLYPGCDWQGHQTHFMGADFLKVNGHGCLRVCRRLHSCCVTT